MKRCLYIGLLIATFAGAVHGLGIRTIYRSSEIEDVIKKQSLTLHEASYTDLYWTYSNNAAVLDLTGANQVYFIMAPPDASWSSTITGSVYNATNGIIKIPFTSSNTATNGTLRWTISVSANGTNVLKHSWGDLWLIPDPLSTNDFPLGTNVDLGSYTFINFPWLTPAELDGSNFVTQSVLDGSNFVDITELDGSNFVTESVLNGSNYVSQEELDGSNFVTQSVLDGSNFVDITQLDGSNFVTEAILDGSNYVSQEELDGSNFVDITQLDGSNFVTQSVLDGSNYLTETNLWIYRPLDMRKATNTVDLTNVTTRVAVAAGADQPVPLSQLQGSNYLTADDLELYSENLVYFETNTHPVLTNDRSMTEGQSGVAWTQTYALAVGTNVLDVWYATNPVGLISRGAWINHRHMGKSGAGNPTVSSFFDLLTSDGTTTNVLVTSSLLELESTISQVEPHVHTTNTTFYTNWYYGIRDYGVRAGGASANLIIIGGTAGLNSHLQTPVLGSAAVIWEDIIGPYTDRVDLNSAITDRYTKAEADAAFLEPTSDGSGLTNISDSITFMIYAPTNGEPYAWGQFDWTCTLTNAQVQMVGCTGIVDIVRKEWNAAAFTVINSNIYANAAGSNDATFADAAYTNGQDVGLRWSEISAVSPTNTLKCILRARK